MQCRRLCQCTLELVKPNNRLQRLFQSLPSGIAAHSSSGTIPTVARPFASAEVDELGLLIRLLPTRYAQTLADHPDIASVSTKSVKLSKSRSKSSAEQHGQSFRAKLRGSFWHGRSYAWTSDDEVTYRYCCEWLCRRHSIPAASVLLACISYWTQAALSSSSWKIPNMPKTPIIIHSSLFWYNGSM